MTVAIADGQRIRAVLKRLRLTQAEFCERHLIREATLSEVIHGRPVGSEVLFTIARAIEVEQARGEG